MQKEKKEASKRVTGNKHFWNAVNPFLTFKGFLNNGNIAINFENRATYNK